MATKGSVKTAKKQEKKVVKKKEPVKKVVKNVEEETVVTDKNIIEKETYMLYFTATFIVVRLICNGLNLIPKITNFDGLTLCVLTNFLMILGTIGAMALNFMIHKKHRVNKHQFNYIKKFMFTMFSVVTLLVNIFWIINYIKINYIVTLILLVIHCLIIYLYTIVLFNTYVEN